LAEELTGRARQIGSIDDSVIEEEKNTITFTTKRMVQAFRGLTQLSNLPPAKIDAKAALMNTYKTFSESIEHYKENEKYSATQIEILSKARELARQVGLLVDSTGKEAIILNNITTMALNMDSNLLKSMDTSILQKISNLLTEKKNITIDIGLQLHESSTHARRITNDINLHASAVALAVELPVFRYVTAEAVSTLVTFIKTMIKIFMEYHQFLAREQKEELQ